VTYQSVRDLQVLQSMIKRMTYHFIIIKKDQFLFYNKTKIEKICSNIIMEEFFKNNFYCQITQDKIQIAPQLT